MELRYAAADSRPVKVIINGKLANGNILRVLHQAEDVARRLQKARPASTATIR
jgi:hypothetical protein